MKKSFKKIVIALFALILAFTSFAGCGDTSGVIAGGGGTAGELDIVIANLGYGTEMLVKIAEEYGNITGVTVNVESTVVQTSLVSQLEAGAKIGDICCFTDWGMYENYRSGKAIEITTGVMDQKPQGEELTVLEKLNPDIAQAYNMKNYKCDFEAADEFYCMPWSNELTAMTYNKTSLDEIFGENNWELPRTTRELIKMMDDVKAKSTAAKPYYSWVWSGLDAYWQIVYKTWWAQYEGVENYHMANRGFEPDGNGGYVLSQDGGVVADQIGLLRAYEVTEKCIRQGNGYSHSFSRNMDFITSQSVWLGTPYNGSDATSIFMPNGDWVYQESMEYIEHNAQEVGFMRVPVISAIVEKLSFYEDGNKALSTLSAAKQEAYDKALLEILDLIDNGSNVAPPPRYKGALVSEEDIQIVRDAREIITSKNQSQMFIPYTIDAADIPLAKDFMVFYASKQACEIYSENTFGISPYYQDGYSLPNHYYLNEVKANIDAAGRRAVEVTNTMKLDWDKGGAPEDYFWGSNVTEKNANTMFQLVISYNTERWPLLVQNAGLNHLLND